MPMAFGLWVSFASFVQSGDVALIDSPVGLLGLWVCFRWRV